MNCDNYRCKYLDHDWTQASLADAVAVAEHLHDCAECRKTAEEYDHMRQLLGNSDALSELGMPRHSGKKSPASRPMPIWLAATAAIAPAALAGCIGWMIYLQTQRPAMPQPHSELAVRNAPSPPQGNLATSGSAMNFAATGSPANNTQSLGTHPPATDIWTPEDVRRGVQVFEEVSATFDGRTSWVALGDRSAEMGLASSGVDALGLANAIPRGSFFAAGSRNGETASASDVPSGKPRVFLLRLVLFRGREEKSRTDLVIVAGQNARLELPLEPGRIVRYVIGTTTAASAKLSLWTEVRSPLGGETMAVLATQMQPHAGQAVSAGRIVTDSGEYSLEVSFAEALLPGMAVTEKLKS